MNRNLCAVILIMVGTGGCATSVATIPTAHQLGASDESIVIGRVESVQPDGQPLSPAPLFLVGRLKVTAEHAESGKTFAIVCDTPGLLSDFYVSLPAGRYRITKVESAALVNHVRASFDVAPRQVVYVGTLRFTGGSNLLTRLHGTWAVVDGPAGTLESFRARFPQVQQSVTRSLATIP